MRGQHSVPFEASWPRVAELCKKLEAAGSNKAAAWLRSPHAQTFFERDTDALESLFSWTETPQGFKFWNEALKALLARREIGHLATSSELETASCAETVVHELPAKEIPWWDRHYTLNTSTTSRETAQMPNVSGNANDTDTLWHEKQKILDKYKQKAVIDLRHFVRSTICGQGS